MMAETHALADAFGIRLPSSLSSGPRFSEPAVCLDGPPYWRLRRPLLTNRASAKRNEVLAFLGCGPTQLRLVRMASTAQSSHVAPASLLTACRRWRLSLQELEGIALPSWGFDYHFRDWETFRTFLYPKLQEFMDGDLVSYWSTTYGAWVEAVVVARHATASGSVCSYDLDVKQGALPGRIRRRHQRSRCPPNLAVDGSLTLIGEVCDVSFMGPARLRYHSTRWAALLDGTIVAKLMTDSHPTMALDEDSAFAEELLRGIRQVPWVPSDNWLFPWHCRRRMVFLAWIGRALGLQQVWAHIVLPLVGWTDALPGVGLAEPPAFPHANEAPDILEQLWALDEEASEGSEQSQALWVSPERRTSKY